jgi:hypothetical protein
MSINIINELPILSWRNLRAPCSRIETTFVHGQAPRPYPYVRGRGHEWTGLEMLGVNATVHFFNTIEPDCYPVQWEKFRASILDDGTTGQLRHPDLGKIDARPIQGSYVVEATTTSGVVCTVSWELTVDDPEVEAEFAAPDVSIEAAAEEADAAMEELGIEYPTGEGETSLTQAVSSVQGQIQNFSTTVSGKINQVRGTIRQIRENHERTMNSVKHAAAAVRDVVAGAPARWVLEANLDIMESTLDTLEEIAKANARPTKTLRTTGFASLASLTSETSNTIAELIQLNPALVGAPTVPEGSTVTYFVG